MNISHEKVVIYSIHSSNPYVVEEKILTFEPNAVVAMLYNAFVYFTRRVAERNVTSRDTLDRCAKKSRRVLQRSPGCERVHSKTLQQAKRQIGIRVCVKNACGHTFVRKRDYFLSTSTYSCEFLDQLGY